MKSIYGMVPLLMVVAACGTGGEKRDRNNDPLVATPYAYKVIACGQSHHTDFSEPAREVITDAERFREVYEGADLNRQSEVPTINFQRQQVVAIQAGLKGNPGHRLSVDKVRTTEDAVIVHYTGIEPSSSGGCMYPAVIVYPYCFIAMDKTHLPVNYSQAKQEASC